MVTGGKVPAHLPKGFFVEPTLFADVDPDSTLAQEEVFGPVLAVIPFEDDDDAVRIANNSIYGLSGAVTSASEARALAVARRIRTGTLSINGAMWFAVDTPFGGYRQSGLGRENGLAGFEEYLETKVIGLPVGRLSEIPCCPTLPVRTQRRLPPVSCFRVSPGRCRSSVTWSGSRATRWRSCAACVPSAARSASSACSASASCC